MNICIFALTLYQDKSLNIGNKYVACENIYKHTGHCGSKCVFVVPHSRFPAHLFQCNDKSCKDIVAAIVCVSATKSARRECMYEARNINSSTHATFAYFDKHMSVTM